MRNTRCIRKALLIWNEDAAWKQHGIPLIIIFFAWRYRKLASRVYQECVDGRHNSGGDVLQADVSKAGNALGRKVHYSGLGLRSDEGP
jgi:hypothetical protein